MSTQAQYSVGFYLRTEVEGGYAYDRIEIKSPDHSWLELDDLPHVGDLFWVSNQSVEVVKRSFNPSVWGSPNWPYGNRRQVTPIMVDLIVIAAPGPFVDEAPSEDD